MILYQAAESSSRVAAACSATFPAIPQHRVLWCEAQGDLLLDVVYALVAATAPQSFSPEAPQLYLALEIGNPLSQFGLSDFRNRVVEEGRGQREAEGLKLLKALV